MPTPEDIIRLGRGQSRISALNTDSFPPLNNEGRLAIGAAGAKNLLEGTIQKNKKRIPTDIQKLVNQILKAAAGKPLKESISEQQDKEEQAAEIVKLLLMQKMTNPEQSNTTPAKQNKSVAK